MNFLDFFQQNIIMFVAIVGIAGYLVYLELHGLLNRNSIIGTTKLTRLVNDGAKLIDLRSEDNFKSGHITGAENVPVDNLENSLHILGDKDKDIVVYCNNGQSSDKAIKTLKKHGFTRLFNLNGGITSWTTEKLPITKK